jgi:hypothetical protein
MPNAKACATRRLLVTIIGATESIGRKMLTLDYTLGCSFLERSQADANWHHRKKDWAQH